MSQKMTKEFMGKVLEQVNKNINLKIVSAIQVATDSMQAEVSRILQSVLNSDFEYLPEETPSEQPKDV